jgi:hypothetical protein
MIMLAQLCSVYGCGIVAPVLKLQLDTIHIVELADLVEEELPFM